jgi:acetyl-CoA carboxylase biotin carboxyl carrier protein
VTLTDDDVAEILRIIDATDVDELRLERDGLSLYVARNGAGTSAAPVAPAGRQAPAPEPPAPAPPPPPEPAPTPTSEAASDGLPAITSPMLGTFYRADAPGRPPFVEVGSEVEPGTVVAIVEVMKMMNSIEAGVAGTIEEVCADNAQLVEQGQPLFRVRPRA